MYSKQLFKMSVQLDCSEKKVPLEIVYLGIDSSNIQSKRKQYCKFNLILNNREEIIKTNIREPLYEQLIEPLISIYEK